MSKRKCGFDIYREWKTESENKLIDNILMFGKIHTKRIEEILSTTANELEKYLIRFLCSTLINTD